MRSYSHGAKQVFVQIRITPAAITFAARYHLGSVAAYRARHLISRGGLLHLDRFLSAVLAGQLAMALPPRIYRRA